MTAHAHALAPTGAPDPFAHGKLIPGVHNPLVKDLDRFAAEAGVHPRYVTGADYALTDFERDYLMGFRKAGYSGAAGMVYFGAHAPPVTERMKSAVGALLRNYISARFIMRDELVAELWDNRRTPKADFIAVPDFSLQGLPDAPRRAVAAWAVARMARGQQLALGFADKASFKGTFGDDAGAYMKHFAVLTGNITPA